MTQEEMLTLREEVSEALKRSDATGATWCSLMPQLDRLFVLMGCIPWHEAKSLAFEYANKLVAERLAK